MKVWTIAAQEGTGGGRIAADLAQAVDVPLLDRTTLTLFAHELDPAFSAVDDLEGRLGGRLNALALSVGVSTGSAEAVRELQHRQMLPDLGRAVIAKAARSSCVIYAPAAFAPLLEHPCAVNVRLRAPLDWRIAAYQREHLVDRRCAEKKLRQSDHRQQAWVKSLYRVDIDDARLFSLVVDASRFTPDRIVETLLAAGGVQSALVAR